MAKLDSKNRLTIPNNLIQSVDTDFKKDIFLYFEGNEFYLDNASKGNFNKHCLGKIAFGPKNRICIPKEARKFLRLDSSSNIACYVTRGHITFKKIVFIPENR